MEDNNQAEANGNATGQNSGESQTQEAKFTQADIDRIVKERLDKAAKKSEEAQKKAAEEAAAKTLTEQGEYKTLAEQRAQRIAELEAESAKGSEVAARLEKYESALKATVDNQLKALPDHLKPLLAKLDLTEQMEWLSANAEKVTANVAGVPETPKASGQISEAKKAEAQQRQGQYTKSIF